MADDQALIGLEHEMGVLLRRVRRVIGERARMVHPELAPVSYLMLNALNEQGPQRASELASVFAIDKGAVSRYVRALQEFGLVERTPDPADRRAATLRVTAVCAERLASVSAQRRKSLGSRMGDWTSEELQEFVRSLARYNEVLEQRPG